MTVPLLHTVFARHFTEPMAHRGAVARVVAACTTIASAAVAQAELQAAADLIDVMVKAGVGPFSVLSFLSVF
jgi:hypothetical protein